MPFDFDHMNWEQLMAEEDGGHHTRPAAIPLGCGITYHQQLLAANTPHPHGVLKPWSLAQKGLSFAPLSREFHQNLLDRTFRDEIGPIAGASQEPGVRDKPTLMESYIRG